MFGSRGPHVSQDFRWLGVREKLRALLACFLAHGKEAKTIERIDLTYERVSKAG